MRRPLIILAIATFAACIGTAALAAEPVIQPDQLRADKLIGAAVYDRRGQDVGSVKDLVLGPDGRISAVVVLYGSIAGIGGKYIAVDFADLKFTQDHLLLTQAKAQLATLPPYRLSGADDEAVPLIVGLGPKAKP